MSANKWWSCSTVWPAKPTRDDRAKALREYRQPTFTCLVPLGVQLSMRMTCSHNDTAQEGSPECKFSLRVSRFAREPWQHGYNSWNIVLGTTVKLATRKISDIITGEESWCQKECSLLCLRWPSSGGCGLEVPDIPSTSSLVAAWLLLILRPTWTHPLISQAITTKQSHNIDISFFAHHLSSLKKEMGSLGKRWQSGWKHLNSILNSEQPSEVFKNCCFCHLGAGWTPLNFFIQYNTLDSTVYILEDYTFKLSRHSARGSADEEKMANGADGAKSGITAFRTASGLAAGQAITLLWKPFLQSSCISSLFFAFHSSRSAFSFSSSPAHQERRIHEYSLLLLFICEGETLGTTMTVHAAKTVCLKLCSTAFKFLWCFSAGSRIQKVLLRGQAGKGTYMHISICYL